MRPRPRRRRKNGFTLIELLVVVLIIGILAAIAVPQYFKVVEKGKAAEAFVIFGDLHGAEERYLATTGNYCTGAFTTANCPSFDLAAPTLKYFAAPTTFAAGTSSPGYKLVLTRNATPAVYGQYQLTYDVEPGVIPVISCSQTNCTTDLMPQ